MTETSKSTITLLLDTSDNKRVRVGLRIGEEEDIVEEELGVKRAQIVLNLIDAIIKKHQRTLKDLTAIEVHSGPGSFTGLRVGISIANTLGFTLQIPINGKPVGEMIEPVYT